MMIKIADTVDKKELLRKYIKSKGLGCLSDVLHYLEKDKGRDATGLTVGNIAGVYGIENKICIEPLLSEGKVFSLQLISDAIATIRTLGYGRLHMITSDDKAADYMIKHYGAQLWGSGLKELILQIPQEVKQ